MIETRGISPADVALVPATLNDGLLTQASGTLRDQTLVTVLDDAGEVVAELSPRDWDARAAALAAVLKTVAKPGDRVIVPSMDGVDFYIAFAACLYAGMIAVPVPALPAAGSRRSARRHERLAAICHDCEPSAIIVAPDAQPFELPSLAAIATVAVDQPLLADRTPTYPAQPETVALLQYTSGSTSEPRGVVLTHHNLVTNRLRCFERGGITADMTSVLWLPLFHDMGLGACVLSPMVSGARVVAMDPMSFVRNPMVWLRAISRYPGAINSAPDFAFHLCVDRTTAEERRSLDLSGWLVAGNGSEPVRAATLRRFAEAFAESGFRPESMRPGYGLAEATLVVTMGRALAPVAVRSYDRATLAQGRAAIAEHSVDAVELVGCGSPIDDVTVRIVDTDRGVALPEREIGEIWVSSPSNGLGYWNRPVETAETFGARLDDSNLYVRTGDLGFFDDGELFIAGRRKDILIIGGDNYYPQDAEAVAREAHPAFANQVVAAWPLAGDDRAVGVVLETAVDDIAVLREALRAVAIAVGQIIPARIEAIAVARQQIPRTTSGKVQRRACADAVARGELSVLHRWAP